MACFTVVTDSLVDFLSVVPHDRSDYTYINVCSNVQPVQFRLQGGTLNTAWDGVQRLVDVHFHSGQV